MVPRWVRWFAATAALGLILLLSSVRSRAGWSPNRSDDHQVLTLNQLLGIVAGSVLLIIAATIAFTVWRNRRAAHRSAERRRRWESDLRQP